MMIYVDYWDDDCYGDYYYDYYDGGDYNDYN